MDDLQYMIMILSRFSQVCFKPCYKWMTFNTKPGEEFEIAEEEVLNLVINGWPSIQ